MKKILYVLIALVLLSGCSNPLKKPMPVPTPSEKGSGILEKDSSISENKPEASTGKNNASQIKEASIGAETLAVNGKFMVKNPDSIQVLVNKSRNLPSDWVPPDRVELKVAPGKYMRKEAAEALEVLFNQALKEGIKLYAVSGYRAYDTQKRIYDNEVKKSGKEAANKVVALPGQSEHQTGMAMDVSCASVNFNLVESFENTKEGKWLKEHAKDSGFIIRYPKDKVIITGYNYEPWHIRYVGKDAASFITSYNITFDEYFGMVAQR